MWRERGNFRSVVQPPFETAATWTVGRAIRITGTILSLAMATTHLIVFTCEFLYNNAVRPLRIPYLVQLDIFV